MSAFEQDPNIAQMEINEPQSYLEESFGDVPSQVAASDILNLM